MKKMLLSLTIATALLTGAAVCSATELKIGYIDIQRALSESKPGKAAIEKLTLENNRMRDEILKEKEKIEQAFEMLQKQSAMLTDDVRRSKELDMARRKRDWDRMVEDQQNEFQLKESQLTGEIIDELIPIVQDYGQKHGFSIIFQRSPQMVLHIDPALDLTDKIIAILDAGFQKKQ
ncbi:MAG: OmpH family outer membrane protein [Deltaproteobacteria bacterium]|nr:OmpH family outer membrane protein [Deltaproteobacteria bacterium]